MGCDFVYLSDCTYYELFHRVRFGEGIFTDAAYCAGGGGVWDFCPALCGCLCIWRWIFQCILSNEPGASYQFGARGCGLWEMGEVEFAVPGDEFGVDQWDFDAGVGDSLLNANLVCGCVIQELV